MVLDIEASKRLVAVIGGEFEDFQELVDDFRSTAPDLLATMKTGLAANDSQKIKIAAHTLKSNARDFGAPELARLSGEAEQQARDGNTADLETLITAIEQHTAEALDALGQIKAADLGLNDS